MIEISLGGGAPRPSNPKPMDAKTFLFPFYFESMPDARVEVVMADGTRLAISDVELDRSDPKRPVYRLTPLPLDSEGKVVGARDEADEELSLDDYFAKISDEVEEKLAPAVDAAAAEYAHGTPPGLTPTQYAHLQENEALFQANCGDDIKEYFHDHIDKYPDLYERVCSDLGLTPVA